MKSQEEKKKKRYRRSVANIDNDIMNAAKAVVREVGFDKATIIGVAGRANVHPNAIYLRYEDLNGLFDTLVREYDHWLNDKMQVDSDLPPVEKYKEAMLGMANELVFDDIMQALLAWELCDNNHVTTKRTVDIRKHSSKYLFENLKRGIPESGADFNTLSALLIGGIFYFVLHMETPDFHGTDFALLKNTINVIVDKVFDNTIKYIPDQKKNDDDKKKQVLLIAEKLFKRGVDYETIKESTGLTDKELQEVSKSN